MIETKELIKHLRQLGKYSEFKPNYFLLAADRIEELSGRVEVVRCKDCAVPHNKWTGCPKLNGLIPPPDFYCSYGERKESEVDTE